MKTTTEERTTEQIVEADLQALIARIKPGIFEPWAIPNATDEEVLGIAISKYFHWAGTPIVKTFYEALEDANFHDFSSDMIDLAKKHDLDPFSDQATLDEEPGHDKRCLVCGEEFTGDETEHFNKDAEHRDRVIQFEEWNQQTQKWEEAGT